MKKNENNIEHWKLTTHMHIVGQDEKKKKCVKQLTSWLQSWLEMIVWAGHKIEMRGNLKSMLNISMRRFLFISFGGRFRCWCKLAKSHRFVWFYIGSGGGGSGR